MLKKIIIAVLIVILSAICIVLLMNYHPKSEFTTEEIEKGVEYQQKESERQNHNSIMDYYLK